MLITRVLVALLAVLACAVGAATASAATLHATPSTLSSVYSGAAGGDTILLASGTYSQFNGGAKSSMVTLDEESGASATINGSDFGTTVRYLTIRNVSYSSSICIRPPTNVNMHLILDGLDMGNVGQGCGEGRITVKDGGTNSIDGSGVQIKNTTFGPGGCSDGIQDSSNGTEIGPGNVFTGITQSCPATEAHADSLQPYASNFVHIHDNWFNNVEQGIMSPDGPSTGYLIENNSLQMDSHQYYCMHLGRTSNGTVRHNVCTNSGGIRVFEGNVPSAPSSNMTVRDNAATVDAASCTGCTIDHNTTAVTFTGGAGRCGFATASPKGTASDGTDIGLNDCGGSPPPPADADGDGVPDSSDLCPGTPTGTAVDSNGCPFQQPPTDHAPVARFTDSLNPSAPGQSVTFDASTATCEDAPCTYYWHDITSTGTGDWPIGPAGGGVVVNQTFQGLGDKYVELVLTDADGDVDKVTHIHTVSDTQPPPDTTAPDTTITSAPIDGTSTSASVSFTSTETGSTFECKLDAGSYAACTSPKAYSGLAVGSHTVSVRATDAAGNTDASPATATWTISSPPAGGAPTFVAEAETSWASSASPKSATLTVQPGDVLVAYTMSEDNAQMAVSATGGLNWISRATYAGAANSKAQATVWTSTVPAGTTSTTVSFTRTAAGSAGTQAYYGGDVLQFRGSSGVGVAGECHTGKSGCSTNPSVTLANVSANSAIVKANVDWSAVSGASRTSLTSGVGAFTETTYYYNSARYTVYGGYHANAGTAGSKTVGYSAPTGQTYTMVAVEVKGS